MKRFTVVVGVDFSELSREAVRVATSLARASGDAELHLVHVLAPPVMTGDVPVTLPLEGMAQTARANLARLNAETLAQAGGVPVIARVVVGVPQEVVPKLAGELRADLVVVGTHGRTGLSRLVFGSVAEAIVRRAPCSVLTVKPRVIGAEELIEPPCPECEARIAATGGEERWCAHHATHHVHAHRYGYSAEHGLNEDTT
jgi:nucleotide-binding universal stress UspA family protein